MLFKTPNAKRDLMTEAHRQAKIEFNGYAKRQGFTYAQTFRSVLSGLWAVRNGFTGEF